jgi:esterase/lipase
MFAMEYPGYGIYTEKDEPNQEQIEKDAQSVYSYMVGTLNIPEKNIILFGRSIGGGPACFLASEMNPRSLILMSAFQSLQKVAT